MAKEQEEKVFHKTSINWGNGDVRKTLLNLLKIKEKLLNSFYIFTIFFMKKI